MQSPLARSLAFPSGDPSTTAPAQPPATAPDHAAHRHAVQFYENDAFLIASVATFLGDGLRDGGAGVVIATAEHREGLARRLRVQGLDLDALSRGAHVQWADADDTLASFMVDGMPNADRFRRTILPILEVARGRNARPVRAFGEMVDLLWRAGNTEAALQLEDHWNDLAAATPFSLLCAYRRGSFVMGAECDGARAICARHSHAEWCEDFNVDTSSMDTSDLAGEVSRLESEARALAAENAERAESERRLRDALRTRRETEASLLEREREISEAQRLESLGLLAGGIAHDFNNVLATILGNAELLRRGLAPQSDDRALVDEIIVSVRRSSELTRQLLAYAGKSTSAPVAVDLGRLAHDVVHMVRSSIPPACTVDVNAAPGTGTVLGDRAQLTQVIMNLVTNAADALGDREGRVTVTVTRCLLNAAEGREAAARAVPKGVALPAGPYVCITVADTGSGMSPETQQRMFEPFFTTKFTGRGLGLAATLGIVRAHAGAVVVDSALHHGTSISVWMPRHAGSEVQSGEWRALQTDGELTGAGRRILVVDDEAPMRKIIVTSLKRAGYVVFEADGAHRALSMLDELERDDEARVDCLLVDITMPGMAGTTMLERVRASGRDLPIVLMSGFSEQALGETHMSAAQGFLAKPFRMEELLHAVSRCSAPRGPRLLS